MPTSWKGDLEIGWRSPHLGWQTGPQNSKSSCTPIDCDLGPHFILCKPVPAIWIVYSEHTCFCRQPFILMSWQGVTMEGVTYKMPEEIWQPPATWSYSSREPSKVTFVLNTQIQHLSLTLIPGHPSTQMPPTLSCPSCLTEKARQGV